MKETLFLLITFKNRPIWSNWQQQQWQASHKCDQIGRFIGLWATFQSLWQQLICPNLLYSKAIFVKVSKSFIFLVKSFLGNFYSHLVTFYWSHCKQASKPLNSLNVFPFMPPSMLNFVIALFPFKNLSRDWK